MSNNLVDIRLERVNVCVRVCTCACIKRHLKLFWEIRVGGSQEELWNLQILLVIARNPT